jgi:hypothetical protein
MEELFFEDQYTLIKLVDTNMIYVETHYYYEGWLFDIVDVLDGVFIKYPYLSDGYHIIYNLNSFLKQNQLLVQNDIDRTKKKLLKTLSKNRRLSLIFIFEYDNIIKQMFKIYIDDVLNSNTYPLFFSFAKNLDEAYEILRNEGIYTKSL